MRANKLTRDEICYGIGEVICDLGLEDTGENCHGLVCYDDTGKGAFRIDGDGSGAVYIDGAKTLKALKKIEYTGDFETDQQSFYSALVRINK